ncbi:unnamed protein product [Phaedon cochleariae]|uniref:WW domain binding protein VOPP1 n=1 Tax=Phaedon cochleariae TaxID=80249 RepID=A0A9P0DHJ8_PHACE|nr:unnamed protein product [Phaedon cochleariae]
MNDFSLVKAYLKVHPHVVVLFSNKQLEPIDSLAIWKRANCLPIFLANDELRFRRIRCNATVLCYCASNNTNLPVLMTTQLVENKCDGGQWTCSPPKQCCQQGCCFIFAPSIYKGSPSSTQHGTVLNPLFLGHWYFWLAVTATVAGILCACSLWRKHSQGNLCCKDGGRDDRASEPDSNSCYAPPQYSRCNSFHQAPPPYSEVTSKPDLYPLVISYNAEPVIKSNNGSTGYLMVQYFRNFIVRPAGSLSATSTNDSLSSSFLCSAVNEANSLIPPPYSHMGSLDEIITTESQQQNSQPTVDQGSTSRSTSSNSNREYQQVLQTSPSPSPSTYSLVGPFTFIPPTPAHQMPSHRPLNQVVSIRDNPCFGQNATKSSTSATSTTTMPNVENTRTGSVESKCQNICDASAAIRLSKRLHKHKLSKDDSGSQTEDDHNFSDLLNLSVCVPSIPVQTTPQLQELQYSVTNSIGSDISSLANLGSPDSPPRATSPTVEMRELLDKIQQLPQQKSPVPSLGQPQLQPELKFSRNYFHKVRAKTLYMPLCEEGSSKTKIIPNVFPKNWLSRSAPCTPCGNFVPNFPTYLHKGGQKGSKTKISDGSPLLKEHTEESEEEDRRDGRS